MPACDHHTPVSAVRQTLALVGDSWSPDVLPLLPTNLAAQAQTLGAFRRVRGLACASDLLRALLAFALGGHSSRSLGAWALLVGLADLSEAAWRKRLRLAGPWLGWLLSVLLAAPAPRPVPTQRRVRLIDATVLPRTGGQGDGWRVHWDYDLTAGRLGSVVLTTHRGGEQLAHFALCPDDILVADAGYGYRRHLVDAVKAQADVVLRFHPRTFPLEDAQGHAFDVVAWLKAPGAGIREWQGWCHWQGRRYALRVLAAPLPEAQVLRARKRTARKAQRKQRRLGATTLFVAGWLLVVTTLDAQAWPAADVLRLYRARWQVELIFKRLKQLLRVHTLRCQRQDVAEASLRALLLAWVLQENLAQELREALTTDHQCPVSSWRLCQLSLETLRQEVAGHWTRARLRACLPRLRRFLCSSPRQREHQETQLRRWLARSQGPARLQQAA
jgi:hypothetical protein